MGLLKKLGVSKPVRARFSLRPLVIELSYKPSLRKLGLVPVRGYPVTAFVVVQCTLNGKQVISKSTPTRNGDMVEGLKREMELMKRLNGLEGVPAFIAYHELVNATLFSAATNFLRFGVPRRDRLNVLVRSYIEGTVLKVGDKLDPRHQQRLLDIVKACHTEGFAGLEVGGPWNFLLGEDGNVHFIDLGSQASRADVSADEFDEFVRNDFRKLERWFD
jgi:predicted Ser/Thr protein kinase